MLLDDLAIKRLKNRKNLLAFSAGSDSSALFFLLLEKKIDFDIAIVNYGLRKESILEVDYAKELAKKYNKKIFLKEAFITPPSIEKKAREIRYRFFEEIIEKYHYENLITAHHLNDMLEWFLMQFTKGAGVVELLGMEILTKKDNYFIVRPMLYTSKEEIKRYLKEKDIRYFIDITNFDISYKRNFFRKYYSDRLIKEFDEGIKRSFKYLELDKKLILKDIKICNIKNLFIIKNQKNSLLNIRAIDKVLKKLGYLLSYKQKEEILKQENLVIGGKIAIDIKEDFIYISPFIKTVMDKKFKELCRVKKIPIHIRGYIYKENIKIEDIKNCIDKL